MHHLAVLVPEAVLIHLGRDLRELPWEEAQGGGLVEWKGQDRPFDGGGVVTPYGVEPQTTTTGSSLCQ